MVFSSFTFLLFFLTAVTLLYYIWNNKVWRNAVLLAASLAFYAWGEPVFVLLMILSIGINFAAGLLMQKTENRSLRRLWMILGVGISVAMLFWFKYSAFLANTAMALFGSDTRVPAKTLPIGISFFTFQIITYTVDVYLGKVETQRNPVKLALYISFFPQLIAGPIVNYTYIAPYLDERTVTATDFFRGMYRFVCGLAKKLVLANLCGEVLENLTLMGDVSTLAGWLGAIAYTLQIFFDFSAYSDMAIGMGRMFGFPFLENFNEPYTSLSVTEFWRRWHISLGAFFREYVYIPLGGNRCRVSRQIFNLTVVWMLTGLWHGASWNFIVWGLYYGALLILEKFLLKNVLKKIPGFFRWIGTMLAVIVGWVLFYHESLTDGLHQLAAMFGAGAGATDLVSLAVFRTYALYLLIAALFCLPFGRIKKKFPALDSDTVPLTVCRFVIGTALLGLSLVFLSGSGFNPFLYFRF